MPFYIYISNILLFSLLDRLFYINGVMKKIYIFYLFEHLDLICMKGAKFCDPISEICSKNSKVKYTSINIKFGVNRTFHKPKSSVSRFDLYGKYQSLLTDRDNLIFFRAGIGWYWSRQCLRANKMALCAMQATKPLIFYEKTFRQLFFIINGISFYL